MSRKANKRQPLAVLLIVIGVLSLLGAAGWLAFNLAEDFSAGQSCQETVEKLEKLMEQDHVKDGDSSAADDAPSSQSPTSAQPGAEEASLDPQLIEMVTYEIEGIPYIGVLEIPSASLVLPVCYEWNYDYLSEWPCRYCGSYYTDDMVICAHNYGSHFRVIGSLDIGETVYFTGSEGKKIKYLVSNIETVEPTDIDKMIVNTKSDGSGHLWDMTLFTCNLGGQTRCAVRLERVK